MISLIIPLTPTPASRPRVTKSGVTYYPKIYREFKSNLSRFLSTQRVNKLDGALRGEFVFYMPIPKSWSRKKQKEVLGAMHISKPDTSNLLKAIEDGLNKIAYEDDSQLGEIVCKKVYSNEPRIEVKIESIKKTVVV